MYIKQLYTNCLAQAAYYIESDGEAAIIDPMREPQPYLDLLKERKASLKYVFETHFHADFVSGHLELFRQTNAPVVYGPGAKPNYPALIGEDKEVFKLGKITIELWHTPGHTVESSCFLLRDEDGTINSIFTGDTLFIGDVGRPDLMSGNLSKEVLAEKLFDSLQPLKFLPPETIVYPGHGAGSACGKNLSKETVSTIADQLKSNPSFYETNKKAFVDMVCSGQPAAPPYFFKDAKINISGYDSFEMLMKKANSPLTAEQVKKETESGTLILDTRNANEFAKGYVPGSINIGLNGDFAVWTGTVIEFGRPLILVCDQGKEEESITRLARIGYDQIKGFLQNGFNSWQEASFPVASIPVISPAETENLLHSGKYTLLDVRRKGEAETSTLKDAVLIPLNELPNSLNTLDKNKEYIVYCAGGYRSMIASSILKMAGFNNIKNLDGGISLVKKEKPEMVLVLS